MQKEVTEQFNADFVKMFFAGTGLGMALLGYSYTHTFYRSFGLSLYQLEMEWLDIFYRGVALLSKPAILTIFAIIVSAGSLLFTMRALFGIASTVFAVAISALVGTVAFISLGNWLGETDARAIWADGAGKAAYCKLAKDADLNGFEETFAELTRNRRFRLIRRTTDETVLGFWAFDAYEPNSERKTGDSYVFANESFAYCRYFGSWESSG